MVVTIGEQVVWRVIELDHQSYTYRILVVHLSYTCRIPIVYTVTYCIPIVYLLYTYSKLCGVSTRVYGSTLPFVPVVHRCTWVYTDLLYMYTCCVPSVYRYLLYTCCIPIVYLSWSYTYRIPIVYLSYTCRIPVVYLSYTTTYAYVSSGSLQ
jgi:hypothetical protein